MEIYRRPPSAADRSPTAESREKVGADMPKEKISPVSVQETYAEFNDQLIEGEDGEYERQLIEGEDGEYERLLADPSPQHIMISFIDRLERAHQYFEFFDFLQNECAFIKTDSKCKDVFLHLIKKPERKTKFNKLDERTIMQSIYERVRELQANQIQTKLSGVDHIPFSDPTLELINQARRGYLLHENPQVELDKMKESDHLFYEGNIIADIVSQEIQYSETTVTVVNLSNEHTDERLIDLLSVCGEVEKIERTSSFVWAEIAHVTFKDTEAAKIAPFAMDPHLISVDRVFESFVYKFPVKNAEDVSSMHEKAIAKYKDLRLYYMQRQNKSGQQKD